MVGRVSLQEGNLDTEILEVAVWQQGRDRGAVPTRPGHQGLWATPGTGRGRKDPLLEWVEEAPPRCTWISDSWSPELGE